LYFCIVLLNGVEVTQKIFRTISHCSSKPSVFHRWVFYFTKMAKEIILTQGKVAIVDDEDFEYLNQFRWFASKKVNNTFYARTNHITNGKWKSVYLHRFILNITDKKQFVDHVNRDALDNRKINLRICTNSQNQMNRSYTVKNLTGYKGVQHDIRINKYRATITFKQKRIWLGHYIDPIDAARAYNAAALKYHGEFANLNKID